MHSYGLKWIWSKSKHQRCPHYIKCPKTNNSCQLQSNLWERLYEREKQTELTRSMLSRGLALLRIRIICLSCPWVTRLLMQPNTTSARGWRDGLYWNANLSGKRKYNLVMYMWFYSFTKTLVKCSFQHTFVPIRSTDPAICIQGCPSYRPGGKQ